MLKPVPKDRPDVIKVSESICLWSSKHKRTFLMNLCNNIEGSSNIENVVSNSQNLNLKILGNHPIQNLRTYRPVGVMSVTWPKRLDAKMREVYERGRYDEQNAVDLMKFIKLMVRSNQIFVFIKSSLNNITVRQHQ